MKTGFSLEFNEHGRNEESENRNRATNDDPARGTAVQGHSYSPDERVERAKEDSIRSVRRQGRASASSPLRTATLALAARLFPFHFSFLVFACVSFVCDSFFVCFLGHHCGSAMRTLPRNSVPGKVFFFLLLQRIRTMLKFGAQLDDRALEPNENSGS